MLFEYDPAAARPLANFIEKEERLVYEAHSTDYQTREALKDMVRDHFAILKVGPGLTFAFREAVFALAMIEDELIAKEQCSNIVQVLDDVMVQHPEYWQKYYSGTEAEQAFTRKYSLSHRARYYWVRVEVQDALNRLLKNLGDKILPYSLLSQFTGRTGLNAQQVIAWKIDRCLNEYLSACDHAE